MWQILVEAMKEIAKQGIAEEATKDMPSLLKAKVTGGDTGKISKTGEAINPEQAPTLNIEDMAIKDSMRTQAQQAMDSTVQESMKIKAQQVAQTPTFWSAMGKAFTNEPNNLYNARPMAKIGARLGEIIDANVPGGGINNSTYNDPLAEQREAQLKFDKWRVDKGLIPKERALDIYGKENISQENLYNIGGKEYYNKPKSPNPTARQLTDKKNAMYVLSKRKYYDSETNKIEDFSSRQSAAAFILKKYPNVDITDPEIKKLLESIPEEDNSNAWWEFWK